MRERIIMAVFDEIKLKSFKFTMNDLATRLSISKTSLYENFSSKAELIAACVEYLMLDLKKQESEIYNSNKSVLNKFRQLLVIKHKVYPLINTAVYDELKKNYPEQWEKVNNFRQSRINNIIELLNDSVMNCGLSDRGLGFIWDCGLRLGFWVGAGLKLCALG